MATFSCPCASTDCAFFPLFLPDNAKYGLDAVVNEGEETLGYTGTDAVVIDDWVYIYSFAADTFSNVVESAQEIASEQDIPQPPLPKRKAHLPFGVFVLSFDNRSKNYGSTP